MNTELISVIIPVYKTEEFLERCVNSVLEQSFQNTEIILVDDGSPDRCPEMCDALAEKHNKIKVIHKENGGLSSARNAGIESSRGSYISFVDSDDFIEKDMLQRLYTLIKKHKADVSMVKYAEVYGNSSLPKVKSVAETVYTGMEVERAFLSLKVDSVCVGLYSREAIGDNRFILGKTSEDIPFNFSVFRQIKKFVYAPEERYCYFYRTESISNGALNKNMFNYLEYRKEIYDHYLGNGPEAFTDIAEALYARAAMGLLSRMALYGISEALDEEECKQQLQSTLREHRRALYDSKDIPFSRKILGFLGLHAYDVLKLMGRMKK